MQPVDAFIAFGQFFVAFVGYGTAAILLLFAAVLPAARRSVRAAQRIAGRRLGPDAEHNARITDMSAMARLTLISMGFIVLTIVILRVF